jgi:hypothetical protein
VAELAEDMRSCLERCVAHHEVDGVDERVRGRVHVRMHAWRWSAVSGSMRSIDNGWEACVAVVASLALVLQRPRACLPDQRLARRRLWHVTGA